MGAKEQLKNMCKVIMIEVSFVSSVVCDVLIFLGVSVLIASVHVCTDSRVCQGVCGPTSLSHPCTNLSPPQPPFPS